MIINVESSFSFFFFAPVFTPSTPHLADVELPARRKQRQEHGDERMQKSLVDGDPERQINASSVSGQGLLR